MSEVASMLEEFHTHRNIAGTVADGRKLRATLHREEHEELQDELDLWNLGQSTRAKIARELADVVYVAYGTAHAFAIDLDAALCEVHRAAMDKVEANCRREDGKIVKPPGFVPPDMAEAVGCVEMPSTSSHHPHPSPQEIPANQHNEAP